MSAGGEVGSRPPVVSAKGLGFFRGHSSHVTSRDLARTGFQRPRTGCTHPKNPQTLCGMGESNGVNVQNPSLGAVVHVSPWLIRQRLSSQVSRRLYCFPCAGGSPASYRAWQAKVDPAIEICAVQLPGRGARLHEKPLTELGELVKSLS